MARITFWTPTSSTTIVAGADNSHQRSGWDRISPQSSSEQPEKTYRFVNVDVEVEVSGGVARVSDLGATAEVELPTDFFTTRGYAPLAGRALLVRYWEHHGRPDQISVVPGTSSGSNSVIHVDERGTDRLRVGDRVVLLRRYAVDGVVWGREAVWLDEEDRFAAALTRMHILPLEAVREDLLEALPQLQAIAVRDRVEDLTRIARDLRPVSEGTFALVGARVVDGTGRPPIEDATVLINDGRIAGVGPRSDVRVPPDASVVDTSDKTIVPGLWDMHGHVSQIEWGPTYLAAGVTTVRDMGGEESFLTALRDVIDEGDGIGPRLLLAGLVDGDDPRAFGKTTASTPKEGRQIVEAYHDAGFQQMKLYSRLEPDVVSAINRRAHELGMSVTGHIPSSLSLAQAMALGMDEVAHLPVRGPDPSAVKQAVELLARRGTVVDPTVPWSELLGRAPETPLESFEPGIEKAPGPLALSYRSVRNETDAAAAETRMQSVLAIVKALHAAGVPIVAGTDGALPGHSLLRSVELFVRAGLTPMEAIQTATTVPARAMGMETEVGTVAVGKRADLLVLDGNPLTDIANLRQGRWVVASGRMYACSDLWRVAGFDHQ